MKMIITNLFSIFDPSTSNYVSMNWFSLFIWFLLIPSTIWVIKNRLYLLINRIINYILKEFFPLISKNPQVLILFVRVFILIIMNNVPGLLPYIFTGTRHISVTLTIALPLWIGLICYGWFFNTSNLLVHLIPNGTPTILMPFIVLIETVRSLIRPLTLAIRLAANIIAGHLLISLIMSANDFASLISLPILFNAQLALIVLEIAVAFIQAYVFRVLITLYTSERIQ